MSDRQNSLDQIMSLLLTRLGISSPQEVLVGCVKLVGAKPESYDAKDVGYWPMVFAANICREMNATVGAGWISLDDSTITLLNQCAPLFGDNCGFEESFRLAKVMRLEVATS